MPTLEAAFSGATTVAQMTGIWFIAQTIPQREVQFAHELRARNIDVYLPIERIRKVYPCGKRVTMDRIFIPRYLSICGDDQAQSVAVESRHRCGNLIRIVNQKGFVAELKRIETFVGAEPVRGKFSKKFAIDQWVEILDGPFEGYRGQIKKLGNDDAVEIQTRFMGTLRPVFIVAEFLQCC